MLSEVPLPRLLEGIAESLRENVEPGVEDEFALMQLRAIGEVLRNLAGRVEWAAEERSDEIKGRRAFLDRLAAAGWPGSVSEDRDDLLPGLTEALQWTQSAGGEARQIAAEYLRETNASERARLRSGMYS